MHLVGRIAPALALLFALNPSSNANDDLVRIDRVNLEESPDHIQVLDVEPGDTVSLSADLFRKIYEAGGEQLLAYNKPHDEFIWESTFHDGDMCNVSLAEECDEDTNFEILENGIRYYVPWDAKQNITIRVRHRDHYTEDQIELRIEVQDEYIPPSQPVNDPEEYQRHYPEHEEMSSRHALYGWGHWVRIHGQKYWVPHGYETDWSPYQHGYWTWTSHGYTWVSYDRWGWYTDHYGVWRHHEVYGWIWRPFQRYHYRPHVVTFVYGDTHVGWYPYAHDWEYRLGYRHGFLDGYYLARRHGHHHSRVRRYYGYNGHSFVIYAKFGYRNLFEVRIGRDLGYRRFIACMDGRRYGRYPGGYTDYHRSRTWMRDRRAVVNLSKVRTYRVGRSEVRYARRVYDRPTRYYYPHDRDSRINRRRVNVGSRIRTPGDRRRGPVEVRPPVRRGPGSTRPGRGGGTRPPTTPGRGGGTRPPSNPGRGGGTRPPSNPGRGGGTRPPSNPGRGGGTRPPSNPGRGGGTRPPSNPGRGGGTRPPSNPGRGGGTRPPSNPGRGGGTRPPSNPGRGGGTRPPSNPGRGGGTRPPSNPGRGGGTRPPSNPGRGGGTRPPSNPGRGGGTRPPSNPGRGGGTRPPSNPGRGGGTRPPSNPGRGGGTRPPSNPGRGGGTRPPSNPGRGGGTRPPSNPGRGGGARPSPSPGRGGGARPSPSPGRGGGARPSPGRGRGGGARPSPRPGRGGSARPSPGRGRSGGNRGGSRGGRRGRP